MSDNKALWKRAFTTDPKQVKPITGKQYSGNSPKPYWIIERLTDEFGPCGIGWGFTILNERFERFSDTDTLHVAVVRFWYELRDDYGQVKRGELEQVGQTKASYVTAKGSFMLDEDAPKKSVTDALIKCASYLGFAGDIFSGRWDDSRYVAEANKEWRQREKGADDAEPRKVAGIPDDVRANPKKEAYDALTPDWKGYIDQTAAYVENLFAELGPNAAADKIAELSERDQWDNEHRVALEYKLSSKARSAISAITKVYAPEKAAA